MSTSSCVLTECMDYYAIYNSCLIQYPTAGASQDKCICTPAAIQGYAKCYPCVTSLPTTTGPIMPIANYTAACNAATNPGGGYTFSGFTGLPTSTGNYYPIPSGTGGSGSGSNNSNSGSSDKGSSNTGLYAGIGAAVGVVVLGIALFFLHRSRKNKKPSIKTTELPSAPPMQAAHHQQPPQPPLPAVPVHNYYQQHQQTSQYQQQNPEQQQNQYQQNQYQQNQYQQNQYTPPTVTPQLQQQYTTQSPVATNYYAQAQGGGGSYSDPNVFADPNQQQHQGYYPTVSNTAPLPQPVPSPTFTPNDHYQQQQLNTFSPVVTASGIPQHQEPMPMPEQSNPHYGITSPSATTNTTAYSPAMTTTNSTSYEAPATTVFAYEAPASIVPVPVPAAGTHKITKVSSHGPQTIHTYSQEQAAAGLPKNPQYVEPDYNNGNNYHN